MSGRGRRGAWRFPGRPGGGERGAAAGHEGRDIRARPGGVGGDRGLAEPGLRRQVGKHRDEPDAESFAAGLIGGVGGEEPDGGLGARVAAGQRRAPQRGAAGDRDDRAAWLKRAQQRLADPVERVLHVHFPVAAEGLPGVALDRPRQRERAGVEHQHARLVRVDQLAGQHGVGRVGGDGGEGGAEPLAYLRERGGVAGDADHVRACLGEGGGDATAEAAARAGDYRGRSC